MRREVVSPRKSGNHVASVLSASCPEKGMITEIGRGIDGGLFGGNPVMVPVYQVRFS